MLPCNVIVQEKGYNTIEVSAIDPVASMQAVDNNDLLNIAKQVQSKLKRVIENINLPTIHVDKFSYLRYV